MEFELLQSVNSENFRKSIINIAEFYNMNAEEVLKKGLLTFISTLMYPNYKNYSYIVSGITQARMVNGVSGRNYIANQIEDLERTYGLAGINENLLERAADLVITSIDSIYERENEKLKTAYGMAIQDPGFLLINFQLIIKILGEYLIKKNIEIENKTLHYMTLAIKDEKRKITNYFIEAYATGDERDIANAKEYYREKMNDLLYKYIFKLQIPYYDAMDFGIEQTIVQKLGVENLEAILYVILFNIQEKIMSNNSVQIILPFR